MFDASTYAQIRYVVKSWGRYVTNQFYLNGSAMEFTQVDCADDPRVATYVTAADAWDFINKHITMNRQYYRVVKVTKTITIEEL